MGLVDLCFPFINKLVCLNFHRPLFFRHLTHLHLGHLSIAGMGIENNKEDKEKDWDGLIISHAPPMGRKYVLASPTV